jgi:hypothetical protein
MNQTLYAMPTHSPAVRFPSYRLMISASIVSISAVGKEWRVAARTTSNGLATTRYR